MSSVQNFQRLPPRCSVAAFTVTLLCLVAFKVHAADAGSVFEPSLRAHEHTLWLRGEGTLKINGFIDVYQAALYAPQRLTAKQILQADTPRCLLWRYLMRQPRSRQINPATEVLRRQYNDAQLAPLASRIEALHKSYRDAVPGSRYALCFSPENGVTLEFNDVRIAAISGSDFARAYFGIWLADRPLSGSLRRSLLDFQ